GQGRRRPLCPARVPALFQRREPLPPRASATRRAGRLLMAAGDRPLILFDPEPRSRGMLFSDQDWNRLAAAADIVADGEGRMSDAVVERHIAEASLIVGQTDLPAARLEKARRLQAVINVEGNFLPNVDYAACFARGIQVLSIGLIGFGNLGRALLPLLTPFRPKLRVFDPWLPEGYLREFGLEPAPLDEVLSQSRTVFVLAAVTTENQALLGAREF